ncbi:hypothetical protein [Aquabacterium sp.]|uniref:hypothetical protein n=1 Tax=Aquabacterium sp. TaxID=1872578 RepID=UPI0035AE6C13
MIRTHRLFIKKRLALLGLIGVATTASALELQMSGFGTAGYAVSDKPYHFQQYVSDDGTVKRDSVVGAQADLKFTTELSATVQAKVAPANDEENRWKTSLAWAFVSWRPNNDWLLRAGKVRLPLYLFSENLDVGQSYDFARMPTEMYSISPTTDIAGLYLTHNWALDAGDLSLDVYSGRAPRVVHRAYLRDLGPSYLQDVNTRVSGAVLTLRAEDSTWRAGVHHAQSAFNNGLPMPGRLAYQSLGGGVGYYMPTTMVRSFTNDIFTVGLDLGLGNGWRVMTELERNIQHDIDIGANTIGGYVSLLRKVDKFTPYVTWSKIKTLGVTTTVYQGLNAVNVPSYILGADQLNAQQRMLADGIPFYDQQSLMLGTSYALTPQSKLKAELMHTWVGRGSVMIDSPAGGPPVAHEGLNVLSLSYNFTF